MKLLKVYCRIEEYAVICLMTLMVLVIVLGAVFRYILGSSLFWWAEELALFCFLWITFLGASVVAKRSKHVRVQTITDFFPKKVYAYIDAMISLVITIFLLFLIKTALELVKLGWSSVTSSLRWRPSYFSLSILVGAISMLIHFAIDTVSKFRHVIGGDNQ